MSVLRAVFRLLISLKLAVTIILGLAGSLAVATFIESLYDTPTGQYYVYRALWFHALLGLLGLQIFFVALSRWPWRPRHTPFLLAHLGILLLLFGSWLTDRYGIDGNLRVSEGETVSTVELSNSQLLISEQNRVRAIPIKWLPPTAKFSPIDVRDYGVGYDIRVVEYLSHAEPRISFIAGPPSEKALAAVHLKISGGPMRITQDYWLWAGDPQWSRIKAGPATLVLGRDIPKDANGPVLAVDRDSKGAFVWKARNSDQVLKQGTGAEIDPGWRGGVSVTVLEWISNAVAQTDYQPSRIQYGQQAPPAAIRLATGESSENSIWLGLGDRAEFEVGDAKVLLGFFPQRIVLPFGVRLDRFTVKTEAGARDPSAYISDVKVVDEKPEPKPATISMNEPLENRGYTLYQASYEPCEPRPVTSILSVNRDPGRFWKYSGSLLIVLGSILLFAMKYRQQKKRVE